MEIWKEIKDYEGLYEISNKGNVRSLNYYIVQNGCKKFHYKRDIKQAREKSGYMVVELSKQGKRKTMKVHRLVAEAFIPNIENKPQVNHIDGNKTNNNVENLEWCTNAENISHAYKKGLTYYTEGRKKNFEKNRIDNSKKVIQCDLNGNELFLWDNMEKAARSIGVCRSGISDCCRGKHKTSGGYTWKYASKP